MLTADSMLPHLTRVVLAGLAITLSFALPDSAHATSLHEIKQLAAFDIEVTKFFAEAVSLDGDTVVVGPRRANSGGADTGGAYVFQRAESGSDNWGEVIALVSSDVEPFDAFGASVSISGDVIVVGAPLVHPFTNAEGAAYLFYRDEGGTNKWGEVKKLVASDAMVDWRFGASVSVSGDTVIVGAAGDAGIAGAAYVFQRDHGGDDNWGELRKVTPLGLEINDHFGASVSLSIDTAIIGAQGDDSGAGAAYIFGRDQGGTDNWGEVRKLLASDRAAADLFGLGVELAGDDVVVGALGKDDLAGAAYIFQRNEGGADNWGEVKKLTPSGIGTKKFGRGVAVGGTTAVIGAPNQDGGAGLVYVFGRDEGGADNWGEVTTLAAFDRAAQDGLGFAVAVQGDIVLAGSPGDDDEGFNAGSAYIFDLSEEKPTPTITPTSTDTPTPTATETLAPTPTFIATPGSVGGIALDPDAGPRPLESPESSSRSLGVVAWAIAAATGAIALVGAAWHTRKRLYADH